MPDRSTIVLVDDHPLFLNAFRDLIASSGDYTVVGVAGCGKSAIALCEQEKPDIALLDMVLPDMSGPELITALKKVAPRTEKIVLSGLESREAIQLALMAGASYYIPKTLPPAQFLSTLASLRGGNMALTGCVADALHWAIRARRTQKSLSSSDLEALRLFAMDLPVKEIALRIRKTESSVYKTLHKSKKHFMANSDGDLRRVARRIGMASAI